MTISLQQDSPVSKGKRVRSARMLAGLTREDLYRKHGIHYNTVKSWEMPPNNKNGLTRKGAINFANVLKTEGVFCEPEWLLTGKGQGPQLIISGTETPILAKQLEHSLISEGIIQQEIALFKLHNKNSKVILVQDEAMYLHFSFGDYVGGVLVNTDFYHLLDNKVCLVIYKDIQIIRKVIYNTNNTFNLVPDNLNFDIIENIRPQEIYQIVWHRIKPVTFPQDLEC